MKETEYDKITEKMLVQKSYILAILWGQIFKNILDEIIKKTFSQYGNKNLSRVKRLPKRQKAKHLYERGIINEMTYKDIKQIFNIRDRFAHIVRKGFANAEVCSLCGELSTANGQKVNANNSYEIYSKAVMKHLKSLPKKISRSDTYTIPLLSRIVIKIKYNKKSKRKSKR